MWMMVKGPFLLHVRLSNIKLCQKVVVQWFQVKFQKESQTAISLNKSGLCKNECTKNEDFEKLNAR